MRSNAVLGAGADALCVAHHRDTVFSLSCDSAASRSAVQASVAEVADAKTAAAAAAAEAAELKAAAAAAADKLAQAEELLLKRTEQLEWTHREWREQRAKASKYDILVDYVPRHLLKEHQLPPEAFAAVWQKLSDGYDARRSAQKALARKRKTAGAAPPGGKSAGAADSGGSESAARPRGKTGSDAAGAAQPEGKGAGAANGGGAAPRAGDENAGKPVGGGDSHTAAPGAAAAKRQRGAGGDCTPQAERSAGQDLAKVPRTGDGEARTAGAAAKLGGGAATAVPRTPLGVRNA